MSNIQNIELLENAAELIDYFEGTTTAKMLEQDLDSNDLEMLSVHVKQARTAQFNAEYNPKEMAIV